MGVRHTVRQGECLFSIARDYGLRRWQTIYDHADNAEFRGKRPDPNAIYPGDELFIPDPEPLTVDGPTDQRHRFRKLMGRTLLRIVALDEQREVSANARYRLIVEGQKFEGNTDGEGFLEHTIPADARNGSLTLWLPPRPDDQGEETINMDYVDQDDPGSGEQAGGDSSSAQSADNDASDEDEQPHELALAIGGLDPVEKISGTQARLYNLGFDPGPLDGIKGPLTEAAVKRFQGEFDLAVDGIPGPQTHGKLKGLHCC